MYYKLNPVGKLIYLDTS